MKASEAEAKLAFQSVVPKVITTAEREDIQDVRVRDLLCIVKVFVGSFGRILINPSYVQNR